ncbi:hypothetical protein C0J52_18617 [Blattella germanica]|nr:hypothetical protein C0J52_18617 [Blattella germanica]
MKKGLMKFTINSTSSYRLPTDMFAVSVLERYRPVACWIVQGGGGSGQGQLLKNPIQGSQTVHSKNAITRKV